MLLMNSCYRIKNAKKEYSLGFPTQPDQVIIFFVCILQNPEVLPFLPSMNPGCPISG